MPDATASPWLISLPIPLFLALGVLQFALGIAVAVRFRRGKSQIVASPSEWFTCERESQIQELVSRLQTLAQDMAGDLGSYQAEVSEIATNLENCSRDADTGSQIVLDFVTQILSANVKLQKRLESMEEQIADQGLAIAQHMEDALTDALTGLPNRRAFDTALNQRLSEWNRRGTHISLALVDVDHFKKCNDRYGHMAGDAVLKQFAALLSETVRGMDLVARIGGEEFAILLPSTDIEEARCAAERVRTAVAKAKFHHESTTLRMTLSAGVATARLEERAHLLLGRADQALYAAKEAGRDRSYWHDGRQALPVFGEISAPADPDSEFATIRDDLRRRVAEVADG